MATADRLALLVEKAVDRRAIAVGKPHMCSTTSNDALTVSGRAGLVHPGSHSHQRADYAQLAEPSTPSMKAVPCQVQLTPKARSNASGTKTSAGERSVIFE